jgi:excisionase family DNA binding protein
MSARTIPPRSREYLSLREAADYTGYSVFTLRELVASGRLPAFRLHDKPGSSFRVRVKDIDALMTPVIPAEITASKAVR